MGVWVLLASSVSAFEVDGWKSGMSLEEALRVAQRNNVSFSPDCKTATLGFDWGRATYGWGRFRKYCYFEYLMEHPTWVKLEFSKKLVLERVLYKFAMPSDRFRISLVRGISNIIESRYGKPKPCDVLGIGVSIFDMDHQCFWDGKTQSLIWVRWPKEENNVVYAEFLEGDAGEIEARIKEWEESKKRMQ